SSDVCSSDLCLFQSRQCFLVVGLIKEAPDMTGNNRPDVRYRLQSLFIRFGNRFQRAEMGRQSLCGCLTHFTNTQRVEETPKHRFPGAVDGGKQISSGFVAHALQAGNLEVRQAIKIRYAADHALRYQYLDQPVPKHINLPTLALR